MKLFSYLGEHGPRIAAQGDAGPVDLQAADSALPTDMKSLLELGPEGLKRAQAALHAGAVMEAASLRLLPPVPDPQKILCVGANYADHAAESGMTVGEEPVIFNKLPTTLCGCGDTILLPKVGAKVDYEAELVVVIGKAGKNIARSDAFAHVAGYACGHDVSARDWQKGKPGGQWTLGKGFDTFAPCGPWLVTADEVPQPGDLPIQLRLNGQTMQDSRTSQLVFKVDYLVSYLSQVCTLLPGDLIYTGTPPGVGAARKPPVFLQPGDVVEVEIAGLGVLRNPVAAE